MFHDHFVTLLASLFFYMTLTEAVITLFYIFLKQNEIPSKRQKRQKVPKLIVRIMGSDFLLTLAMPEYHLTTLD